jgi:P pilus assembly chaperone PapD
MKNKRNYLFYILVSGLYLTSNIVYATGMVPETSLLVIEEAKESGTINVKNTDSHPSLLYTQITDLPDDTGTHLLVTQPVTRVEAGETQQLRFILQTDAPLKTEHLKRVVFEGIPPKEPGIKHQININLRQDIPVLIRPTDLAIVPDAWTKLSWHIANKKLTMENKTPYVIRLAQQVKALPSGINLKFNKTYILPGQTLSTTAPMSLVGNTQIKFYPASRYGVEVPSYTASIQ